MMYLLLHVAFNSRNSRRMFKLPKSLQTTVQIQVH